MAVIPQRGSISSAQILLNLLAGVVGVVGLVGVVGAVGVVGVVGVSADVVVEVCAVRVVGTAKCMRYSARKDLQ